jgi:hypothetical protein
VVAAIGGEIMGKIERLADIGNIPRRGLAA